MVGIPGKPDKPSSGYAIALNRRPPTTFLSKIDMRG